MFPNIVSRDLLRKCLLVKNQSIPKRFIQGTPDFTKNTCKLSRGPYNYLNDSHIQYFDNLLGDKRIVMDLSDLEKYNVDWYHQVRGCSTLVLKPKTTEEVSKIISFCNVHKLAVCPQGGNTSVVGGSVPVFDEIVLSTELMDAIIHIDENAGTVVCQSGCVLEKLDNALEEKGLIAPLDIGAKGTCHLGGNVSTNAGGMRLLRFGSMHSNVLGLEVVKADGEVLDLLSTLKKDNTGYHLKHLFIGSEGSLGIVTKVALECPSRPKFMNIAFLGVQNFNNVVQIFRETMRELGEIVAAFEIMDSATMDFIKDKNNQTSPIGEFPFYLMIETLGSNESHDAEKLNCAFQKLVEKDLVSNGTVVSETHKVEKIWSIRENISNGYKNCAAVLYYDVTLPIEKYYSLVEDVRMYLGDTCERVFGYGHLGDGNLHLQVQLWEKNDELKEHIEQYVFEQVAKMNGSISAEHGLGFLKSKYLKLAKPVSSIKLMYELKALLDPKGILNPYKVLSR